MRSIIIVFIIAIWIPESLWDWCQCLVDWRVQGGRAGSWVCGSRTVGGEWRILVCLGWVVYCLLIILVEPSQSGWIIFWAVTVSGVEAVTRYISHAVCCGCSERLVIVSPGFRDRWVIGFGVRCLLAESCECLSLRSSRSRFWPESSFHYVCIS